MTFQTFIARKNILLVIKNATRGLTYTYVVPFRVPI